MMLEPEETRFALESRFQLSTRMTLGKNAKSDMAVVSLSSQTDKQEAITHIMRPSDLRLRMTDCAQILLITGSDTDPQFMVMY